VGGLVAANQLMPLTSAVYLYCLVRAVRQPSRARVPSGLDGASRPKAVRVAGNLWVIAAHGPLDIYGPSRLEPRTARSRMGSRSGRPARAGRRALLAHAQRDRAANEAVHDVLVDRQGCCGRSRTPADRRSRCAVSQGARNGAFA
jgi:hypothetical protein